MSDAAKLTFYTNPMSRGRIIRWMLEEVGCEYETVLLDYASSMKAADYLAINPMGKVPAIRHGDAVVTEAAAICAYLADAFPDAGLAPPPGNQARAPYYRWMFFAAGPVEAVITGKSLGLLAPEEKRTMAGYGTFEDTIAALEAAVSGPGPGFAASSSPPPTSMSAPRSASAPGSASSPIASPSPPTSPASPPAPPTSARAR
jgi:glutathione S-transferase